MLLNCAHKIYCPQSGNIHEDKHNLPILQNSSYDDSTFHYPVSYTHLRAHETVLDLVCRLLLEKNKYEIIIHTGVSYSPEIRLHTND